MIEEISLRVSPQIAATPDALRKEVAARLGIHPDSINCLRIIRRSVDARQRNVVVNLTVRAASGEDLEVTDNYSPVNFSPVARNAKEIIIVGAGPAGLFAALRAIELGIRPILLERGHDVDTRRLALTKINREGLVDPESNYCFGEGGAGAYSDGKLFTRSKKRGNTDSVLNILHQHGASRDILIDSHPHIGSDKLPHVIKNIRQTILECGGEVRFGQKVTGLLLDSNRATGVKLASGEEINGDAIILATGHSARDVYRFLHSEGVKIEAKGLAMGVRLEHPQNLIDCLQYHSKDGRGKYLPAAEYNFVTQVDGRGVYSFCMCPGGVIVPAMSGPGQSVVNGMSASARASRWANSGMVVELHPGDIPGFESYGPLEMMALQEALEKKFYEESGSINAPAQRMTDFVYGKLSATLPRTSYAPGIHPSRLDHLLPPEISTRLKNGFIAFNKKCKGFLTDEAVMIGLESRTSSPVRIPRNPDTLDHVAIENLYPAGEGAGYAGGIVSAAVDGQRCVDAVNSKLFKSN